MAKWSYTQIENVDVDVRGFLISNRGKLFATDEVQLTDNAIDIFRNRARYDEMYSNTLRRQYFDKSNDNVVLDLTKDEETD